MQFLHCGHLSFNPAARFDFRLCCVFVVCRCFIWRTKAELRAGVGRPQTSSSPPSNFIAFRPRRLFCFSSLVVLDVLFRYLSLILLYINIKMGKIDV